MTTAPSLLELQRAFVQSVLGADTAAMAPWVVSNGLGADERLQIYRNMVFATQTGALRTSFPTVLHLVGEACFDGVAARYIAGGASRCGNLQRFGATFARFLAEQPELVALPYLHDVAALDWARLQSCLAAEADALAPAMLAGLSEDALARCVFAFHPSTALIESRYPLCDIWRFCQDAGEARLSLAAPAQSVLVWRSGTRVSLQALPTAAGRVLCALLSGTALGPALDAGVAAGEDVDLASLLGLLLHNGLIVGSHLD